MHSPPSRDASHPTPPSLARVTVVVVSFHSAHCAPQLGQSLAMCPHVVVVDNASGPDTLAAFRQHLPQAQIIANARNLGFGAANNLGVQQAHTEFVLLLNPDCVLDSTAIEQLVLAADRHPQASLIAPQLLDRQGRPEANYRWKAHTWAPKGPVVDADACVGFASGACMLIRREAMQRIGGFDEDFFLYYEDDDLCLRLWQQCGPLIVTPAAQVQHLSRGSSGGKAKAKLQAEYNRGYHHIQSKFLFEAKHAHKQVGSLRRGRYAVLALIEAALRLLLLDTARAARVFGRFRGALAFRPN